MRPGCNTPATHSHSRWKNPHTHAVFLSTGTQLRKAAVGQPTLGAQRPYSLCGSPARLPYRQWQLWNWGWGRGENSGTVASCKCPKFLSPGWAAPTGMLQSLSSEAPPMLELLTTSPPVFSPCTGSSGVISLLSHIHGQPGHFLPWSLSLASTGSPFYRRCQVPAHEPGKTHRTPE